MGGLRVRVTANQPLPSPIRRDFSHDADHLWGTGAFLMRRGHYVHTTTDGPRSRARSAEPLLPRLDAAPATETAASPVALAQSAVFEYDSPGTAVASQQAIKRGAQQLWQSPDTKAELASAEVLRNLDRYIERWTAGGSICRS